MIQEVQTKDAKKMLSTQSFCVLCEEPLRILREVKLRIDSLKNINQISPLIGLTVISSMSTFRGCWATETTILAMSVADIMRCLYL